MKIRFRQIPFPYRENAAGGHMVDEDDGDGDGTDDDDGVGVGADATADDDGVGAGRADVLEGLGPGVGDTGDTAAWAGTMMVPTTGFVQADGSTVSPTAAAATA